MGLYEDLLVEHDYIEVRETDVVPNNLPGVWLGDLILIKRNLSDTRKAEILLEELSHNKLTYGDIRDQTQFNNRKFENYARRHGYEAALPLRIIVEAHHYGVSNLYELAEYVQLSEKHVMEILEHYKNKHGIGTHYGDYSITFEPLRVFKYKEI
ncbi:ImmA/IrrE family metallo-endopeptidase [Staphylococcus epidermidis]|jgi:conserved phage protein|uniref:ImmA/IrrE family metallo-endopeptidase n=1 Tax=Staphylococcus epidermidis TaxID=1282 RepID=UPI0019338690|nr:ImmA/IrrE family metallo-endopeptidase [Staphylococcus epidermidis]MBM0800393.1 ImmA/IrrE family metallo-endopeptidase [Staphylococcus epidermidis]MCO6345055.1 ImmA/IrrE family metallo-endopeptidase [Staphylococcus epidermidis]DAT21486.1 MAG TPA: IrrE protein [Caudoviricetes sp.]